MNIQTKMPATADEFLREIVKLDRLGIMLALAEVYEGVAVRGMSQ